MANAKANNGNYGCVVLFIFILALGLAAAIIQGIATGLTNVAVWMMYGPIGLPHGVARTTAYPAAWALFGGLAAAIGAAVAVVLIERRRLRLFRISVAAEHPPKPPRH